MPRNKLVDLNNHLFEQLERLNDEDLTGEELERELERTKAMTNIGRVIVDNARLALDAVKLREEFALDKEEVPKMLTTDSEF